MISNNLLGLTSISQWALFLGIASILFGWIEKRKRYILVGNAVFLLLGFMALWILLTDYIEVPEITSVKIPKQMKVLAFFKVVAIFSGFNVISLLMNLLNFRFQKTSIIILMIFAMMLFFMVFNIQQTA